VRKFACWTATCPRKVFAERLPDLVQPWARVSKRLLEELKAIGLAASAEVSERLAPRLGMKVKAPTLLRYLRTIPAPSDTPVRVLGLDDFAMRRGDRCGTILVNLETGKPLDLLPDRTAEAVFPWLEKHQEIDVVSRDRASAYADVRIVDEIRRMQKIGFATLYAQQRVRPSQISEDRFRHASEPEGTLRHHFSQTRKILCWLIVLPYETTFCEIGADHDETIGWHCSPHLLPSPGSPKSCAGVAGTCSFLSPVSHANQPCGQYARLVSQHEDAVHYQGGER